MNLKTAISLLPLLLHGVSSQCNVDDHHPENGGYFFIGAAGISSDVDLDSAHGQKLPNNTWALGIDYPYGQMRISGTRPPCNAAPGCPWSMETHTCSILKFCPHQSATSASQDIYLMQDEDSMNACNFATATKIGTTFDATNSNPDDCVHYVFEDDHELTSYHFSSPEGCNQGQKLKVDVAQFELTADQCKAIGNDSPRIRNCDCRLEKTPSALGEPCRTAFSDQCEAMTVREGDCCEQGTCLSRLEDFSDPIGRQAELDRRDQCNNDVPGLCYNEDGRGTDTNGEGSTNCCTRTCTECGIEDNPFAKWKECSSADASNSTAKCGFLSRYDSNAFECDFSLCAEGDHWHPGGDSYKKFFNQVTTEDSASAPMRATQLLVVTLPVLLLSVFF